LTGTRWTRYQHHTVRLQNIAFELLQRLRFKSELGHVQPEVFLVQQPHDDFFAVERGHSRNAEVQFLFLAVGPVLDHDAAVLRETLFRNVQFSHDLQAAGDCVLQAQGRSHHRGKLSVDAEPHADLEATTGSTLNPVMNLMSSIAKTLVGSVMAMVSTEPTRESGITW